MLRLIIILVGTYAAYHTDLQSENILHSTVFPVVNAFYIYFLFTSFVGFLRVLSARGTKGNEVNAFDLAYDVLSLLYDEISSKYSGRFDFFGRFSEDIEDFVVPMEIMFVIVSFYQELQLLAYLAN